MELVVKTEDLRNEILAAKENYLKTQTAGRKLYAEKIMAYAQYVVKCVAEDRPIKKGAPYLLNDDLTNFEKALDGLKMHTGGTIRIGSDELSNLRQNISYSVTRSSQAVEELQGLAYIA